MLPAWLSRLEDNHSRQENSLEGKESEAPTPLSRFLPRLDGVLCISVGKIIVAWFSTSLCLVRPWQPVPALGVLKQEPKFPDHFAPL